MMMGALAVPVGTLFFFFELNTPRNVTFATTLMLVSLGGVASLFLALVGFKISNLGFLGDSDAGIVEEVGKLLAVVLVVRQTKYKYILNGILFGAAIGCGFSAFETAGYAFSEGFLKHAAGGPAELLATPGHADLARSIQSILSTQGYEGLLKVLPDLVKLGWNLGFAEMFAQIHYRSLLAPFGHIVWTAISAGALWRVKGDRPLQLSMLIEPTFLRAMFIPMALHAAWNSPLIAPGWTGRLQQMGLGVIAYFVVFSLVQQGLRQVREEQLARARSTYRQTQEILTVSGRFRARES
jgi:RsiW-degrading membrane proteinase PrsW (M82 family)